MAPRVRLGLSTLPQNYVPQVHWILSFILTPLNGSEDLGTGEASVKQETLIVSLKCVPLHSGSTLSLMLTETKVRPRSHWKKTEQECHPVRPGAGDPQEHLQWIGEGWHRQ